MSLPTDANPNYIGGINGGGVLDTRDVLDLMHDRSRMTIDRRPPQPYNAGTEHVGFSQTRQIKLAPRAKRREVSGESHEG